MEHTVQANLNSEFSFPPSMFYKFKPIKNWKDFLKTILPVKFDQITQESSFDDVHTFWKNQIELLMKNEEKICILVPAKRVVKTNKKPELFTSMMDMDLMANSRAALESQKINSKQANQERQVNNSIYKYLIMVGIQKANQDTVNLRYDYDSMFLGNQKQLLIYKYCYSIEKYMKKYKLTQVFKDYLDEFEKIAVEREKSITERNRALSLFKKAEILKQTLLLSKLNVKIKNLQQKFNPYLKKILNDFTSRQKSKQISLKNINDFILQKIRPICLQQNTDIIDEHESYELDLYRDILIVKAEDPRLIAIQTSNQIFDEVEYQYTYLSPQVQIVPPDDLQKVQLVRIDLKQQCYVFNIGIRKSFQDNRPEGIFIRSKHGDDNHEQNFDLPKICREQTVLIYPYSLGKIAYQIYIWNKAGIICSTFSINLYNELLKINKQRCSFKHRKIHLVASMLQPNKYLIDTDGQLGEEYIKMVRRNKQLFKVKDFYAGSTAIACDWSGDVTIWGGSYGIEETNEKHQEPILKEIKGLYIRKVSCGASHYLLLSIFGDNICGQLGLGKSFNEGIQIREPEEIVNFNDKNLFFTDILAHTHFCSFAITERGVLYRWGLNQIEETEFPIYDRFQDIINYSLQETNIFTHDPIKVISKYISGRVIQIAAYAERFFALTECGDCYGWGDTSFLGIELKDCKEKLIEYIVNPLKLMGNIRLMAPGGNHCVVITKDGLVRGWGDISCFTQYDWGIASTPIDITEQYGSVGDITHLKAGFTYTAAATGDKKVKIMGSNSNFICNQIEFFDEIVDLQCSLDSILGILTSLS